MARRLRYIECDGQVYLVRRNGKLTFPSAEDAVDFPIMERHSTRIGDDEVVFCRARLGSFPQHWAFKDEVIHRPDIDEVVGRAINASLARCVCGAVVQSSDGKVLMVMSNRGFTKGMWNIPGGFIEYGEHPLEATKREVQEETGIEIEVGRLLGVYKERFQSPYFMYGFIYEARPKTTDVTVDPTEIEAAQWMPPKTAHDSTRNPFARAAFREKFRL